MQKAGEMHPLTARLQPWRECKQPRPSWVPAALLSEHRETQNLTAGFHTLVWPREQILACFLRILKKQTNQPTPTCVIEIFKRSI